MDKIEERIYMGKLIVELYGHPILFVITLLFILGILGMTYEFVLRLFGRPSDLHSIFVNDGKTSEDEEDDIVKVDESDNGSRKDEVDGDGI